jgi:hypothetical protein
MCARTSRGHGAGRGVQLVEVRKPECADEALVRLGSRLQAVLDARYLRAAEPRVRRQLRLSEFPGCAHTSEGFREVHSLRHLRFQAHFRVFDGKDVRFLRGDAS